MSDNRQERPQGPQQTPNPQYDPYGQDSRYRLPYDHPQRNQGVAPYPARSPYQDPRTTDWHIQPPVEQTSGLSVIGFILSFFTPIVGLVLSVIARDKAKRSPYEKTALSTAGIIISIINLALRAFIIMCILHFGAYLSEYQVDHRPDDGISAIACAILPRLLH
ncbi:DUF4190 domain-containing protein [Bifidobacterium xylocopae]|uniref:DUF4190 domain-containing protein n=1 Tax=Bifidobacterium xylocopae TaxID=2493119 RepID=A0A366KDL2_9BIFI|nr:DUF4190 domain-containing protein [Bifidobacterium xylocopae]RBP99800.1 hypothetical protein CRD59_01825 [Bifidobacterium xylocopae]